MYSITIKLSENVNPYGVFFQSGRVRVHFPNSVNPPAMIPEQYLSKTALFSYCKVPDSADFAMALRARKVSGAFEKRVLGH